MDHRALHKCTQTQSRTTNLALSIKYTQTEIRTQNANKLNTTNERPNANEGTAWTLEITKPTSQPNQPNAKPFKHSNNSSDHRIRSWRRIVCSHPARPQSNAQPFKQSNNSPDHWTPSWRRIVCSRPARPQLNAPTIQTKQQLTGSLDSVLKKNRL